MAAIWLQGSAAGEPGRFRAHSIDVLKPKILTKRLFYFSQSFFIVQDLQKSIFSV
jgi:hypothetical protein